MLEGVYNNHFNIQYVVHYNYTVTLMRVACTEKNCFGSVSRDGFEVSSRCLKDVFEGCVVVVALL